MTASRDPDRLIHAFLQDGEELLQDQVFDAVRGAIEDKRQRAFIGPWRTPTMNRFLTFGLGAAAVVVVGLLLGAQLLGKPTNSAGASETPATLEPTATLHPSTGALASGSFTADLGEFGQSFDIDASKTGDGVSGSMEVSMPPRAEGAYSVNLQCTRTAANGQLVIAGVVTASTYELVAKGAYVAITLVPGTPIRTLAAADVLESDEVKRPADSCAAFAESLVNDPEFTDGVSRFARPINGDLELGQ